MAETRWGIAALALLAVAGGLLWWGFGDDASGLVAIGIVVAVLGLACLRARSWIRRTRRLTAVGLDLHVPDDAHPDA